MQQFLTRSFLRRLLIGDGALVILMILYNLLAMVIPVVRLTCLSGLLILILINVLLIGIKIAVPLLNQQSQP